MMVILAPLSRMIKTVPNIIKKEKGQFLQVPPVVMKKQGKETRSCSINKRREPVRSVLMAPLL